MKRRLVVRIILFLLPVLAVAICAEMYARSIPNSYRYKKIWMEAHKDSVKTLILGNSHMYSAIVPSILVHAFNLSNSAQSLEYDFWLINEYIVKCPNLATILINIDNMNLFSKPYEQDEKANNRIAYYGLYMGCQKYGFLSKYHYELSCPKFMCSKIEKYAVARLMGKRHDIQCDSLGRGTYYGIEKQNKSELKESSMLGLSNKENIKEADDIAKNNFHYMQNIAKVCKKHGVRLIVISTPYWHLYNKYGNKERFQQSEEYAIRLSTEENIEYYNFRQDARFCKNEEYFVDRHHLSDIGAVIFTEIISKELGV